MKLLLVRPRVKRQLASFVLRVEPLELEMISTFLKGIGIENRIFDELLFGKNILGEIRDFKPTHVLFTGYLNAVDEILKQTELIKKNYPEISVIVGGIHARINYEDFYSPNIDIVVHSGGIKTLDKIIKYFEAKESKESIGCNINNSKDAVGLKKLGEIDGNIKNNEGSDLEDVFEKGAEINNIALRDIKGISYREGNSFIKNPIEPVDEYRDLVPDRSFFYDNLKKFRYIDRGPAAIVKTAFGCPYSCNFCFCRLIDSYSARDINDVLDEIEGIKTDTIWIIDDSFLLSRDRISEFCEGIKDKGIRKKFIIYSRADFIANNEDIIEKIKKAGVAEVIVGLEAPDDKHLKGYEKGVNYLENERCLDILRRYDIACTGLFLFPIDADFKTVKDIIRFIKKSRLYNATFSIFTPLKGTKLYEKYKDRLTTNKSYKYNFLNLVIKPEKLSSFTYMLYFYILNLLTIMLILKERLIRGLRKFGNMGQVQ